MIELIWGKQKMFYLHLHLHIFPPKPNRGPRVQEHLAPGSQTDQVWSLTADKMQRQRAEWWWNKKEISEAHTGKTTAISKTVPQSAENTYRFVIGKCGTKVGGYRQLGGKGQANHCLGWVMWGLAGSGQSLLLEGVVSVPITGSSACQVLAGVKISWKELNQLQSTDSGQNGSSLSPHSKTLEQLRKMSIHPLLCFPPMTANASKPRRQVVHWCFCNSGLMFER